jgi:hypothetical protein
MLVRGLISLFFIFYSLSVLAKQPDLKIASVAQEKTITIAAPHITSLIEQDDSGIYQRILGEALTQNTYTIQQEYAPYKRALLSFERKHVDCVYSFTQVMKQKLGDKNIIASYPLGAFAYYIFTQANSKAITTPKQLEGLRVGAVYGHENYYRHKLNKNITLTMVNKDSQNIQKLSLKRIDAMIGAIPDLQPYTDSLSYSTEHPLVQSFDRITCHNNVKNRGFIEEISSSLMQMKHSGRYQDISGDLFFDFDDTSKQ